MGSAAWSRVGAEHTCRTVRDTVLAAWPTIAAAGGDADALATALGAALGDGVATAARTLRDVAAATEGVAPRDFRCTVIAAAWGAARGHEALVCVQVGDGVAATRDHDGTVSRTAAGDSGDFSGEVTCFVPDEGCEARAATVVRLDPAAVDVLLVATDGIEDPFYPIAKRGGDIVRQLCEGNDAVLDGFVRQPVHGPVFGTADGAANLATWLTFEKRGENDDRTIVALRRRRSPV
ncbi:MAG: protein phosphatase 2C domain-containing protein [Gemmatimonadaceae bacterium]|nr:protein phosphatase 2C domain-containing protein [Gemmatimonadaceae bacterium]